jgi:thioredoxin
LPQLRVDYSDCFDKESLLKRLEDAIEGKIPTRGGDASKEVASVPEPAVVGADDRDNNASTTTQPNADTTTATQDNAQSVAAASKQKEEAIVFDEAKVYEEVRGMKVKELREELAKRRLRWADLLEKSDLVRAVVQARKTASNFSSHITPGTVADLTEEQVQDELQQRGGAATTPLLLDVYATWCGPCKMMAKELAGAATEWHDRVRLAKMDSDKYPRLASTFKVQGLPTIILFDANGQEVDRLEGALPKAQLMQWVENKLNSSSSSS